MTKAHMMAGMPPSAASLPNGSVSPSSAPVTRRSPGAEFQRDFMMPPLARFSPRPDQKTGRRACARAGKTEVSVAVVGKYRNRHEFNAVFDQVPRLVGGS